MRLALSCLLILVAAQAEAQYQQFGAGFPDQYSSYYRGQLPLPSFEESQLLGAQAAKQDPRFFFTTLTVTLSTSTITTTFTSSTTCTTSTSTLKVCTPSGRRRRGISVDKEGRGLFYNEQEDDTEDGSIFLPSKPAEESPAPVAKVEEPVRVVRETAPVPYVVQPGFNVPKEAGSGRFLLAFGTSTTTFTTTSTQISTLTATCRSTTAFQTCGSTGK